MTSKKYGPFSTPSNEESRLKMLVFGDAGSGKSFLASHFPNPVGLDLEGGLFEYAKPCNFDFPIFQAGSLDQINKAIKWLNSSNHDRKTLIVDPITIVWELIQNKWADLFLNRNKGSKGHRRDYYVMQPLDWRHPKSDLKRFIRAIQNLDMNVICIAREKNEYAGGGGDFMKVVGVQADCERGIKYEFDTVVHLTVDDDNFFAEVLKDRCGKKDQSRFPEGRFKNSYDVFKKAIGKSLNRKAEPTKMISDDMVEQLENLWAMTQKGEKEKKKNLRKYGVESWDDLTAQQAEKIYESLKDVVPF